MKKARAGRGRVKASARGAEGIRVRTGAAKRSLLRIVIGVLALGVVAHGLHSATGIGNDALFADWIYNLLMWGAVALCLARTLSVRAERAAWAAMTAGLAMWSAADLTWTLHYNHLDEAPYPNFSRRPLPGLLPLDATPGSCCCCGRACAPCAPRCGWTARSAA